MDRIAEFTINHPFLISGAAFVIAMIIATELRKAKGLTDIGGNQAVQLMNKGALVLDLRDGQEYEKGHIISAKNIPTANLEQSVDSIKRYKEKPVILCCETGLQAGKAASSLTKMGFSNLVNLRGGLKAWREENLPLVKD